MVDLFGEGATDALDLREVVHACREQAAQAAEALEQLLAPLGAHAGDALERRARAGFAAARPMALDGEPVRLVADLLDKMKRGVIPGKLQRLAAARHQQLLEAGFALLALG